jgi:cellulose biosynthesis protein BcsQ/tetratricopeptide (TPR) repeat protein
VSLTPLNRRVITFYSYKGGVGRTMALANVAYRLANTHGLRVIAVDWDLEAPGLHRFFGIPPEVAARTNGILDYFLAWREAVERDDPEPPPEVRDVASWIIPVEDKDHKPKFGAVSLLLAGRQDKTYDERLARFDWRDFYADAAGAVAVEKLRKTLIDSADVVLIDSRTGLTDPGGICTIQMPDGVVLMTAPNEQSLEGIEGVARTIVKAHGEERAERPDRIKVWLAVARAPSNEEKYLAEEWFKKHEPWFEKGLAAVLWVKEDHPAGIRSLEIPHAARWGFGETVLRADVRPTDSLVVDYDRLTGTLLRWLRGEPPLADLRLPHEAVPLDVPPHNIAALSVQTAKAEERGDRLGLGIALVDLALEFDTAGKTPEAIRNLDQAVGIFLALGARTRQMYALGMLGSILLSVERFDESEQALNKSLEMARELRDQRAEALALGNLAGVRHFKGANEEAIRLFDQALTLGEPFAARLPFSMWRIYRAAVLHGSGRKQEGVEILRELTSAAHKKADRKTETRAIKMLLDLTTAAPLPDADALRARLAELNASTPGSKS